jgi:hypothetical protein
VVTFLGDLEIVEHPPVIGEKLSLAFEKELRRRF